MESYTNKHIFTDVRIVEYIFNLDGTLRKRVVLHVHLTIRA